MVWIHGNTWTIGAMPIPSGPCSPPRRSVSSARGIKNGRFLIHGAIGALPGHQTGMSALTIKPKSNHLAMVAYQCAGS
jgi:hypothetical protein